MPVKFTRRALMPLSRPTVGDGGRHPLTTVVEDDDAGADVFCAPEEPARFDIFDNDREANLFAVPMSQ